MDAPRTVRQMRNRPTSYEVGLYDRATGAMLKRLAFTPRRTKGQLLSIACANSAAITAIEPDADTMTYTNGSWCTARLRIAWTGNTERDCACAMEIAA